MLTRRGFTALAASAFALKAQEESESLKEEVRLLWQEAVKEKSVEIAYLHFTRAREQIQDHYLKSEKRVATHGEIREFFSSISESPVSVTDFYDRIKPQALKKCTGKIDLLVDAYTRMPEGKKSEIVPVILSALKFLDDYAGDASLDLSVEKDLKEACGGDEKKFIVMKELLKEDALQKWLQKRSQVAFAEQGTHEEEPVLT